MNNRRYIIANDIINIILQFIIAFCIMGPIFLFLTGDMVYIWKGFYLIPAPFVSYMIGKWTKRLWTFITLHLLMIACYALIFHNLLLNAVFCLYLIVLAIMTFTHRIKEHLLPGNTSIVFVAIVVICYLYSNYLQLMDLKRIFFGMAIFFALLYLINLYLLNFRNYFSKHEDMDQLPIRQIEFSNHILFVAFGTLCFAVMLLFTFLPMNDILSFFGRLIVKVLRAIFSLFHFKMDEEEEMEQEQDFGHTPMPTGDHPILKLLSEILYYSILILIIVVTIVGIIYGLNYLYKKFYAKRMSTDKLESISPFDKKQRLKRENSKSVRKMFHAIFGKTNNEKIRKYYYNAVITKANLDQVSKQMTPTQLSRYIFEEENKVDTIKDEEKEKELTELYEKARYSKEECSKKDFLKVKELLK